MVETITVFIIVGLAMAFVGKRIYRTLSNKNMDCGCGAGKECSVCSVSDNYPEGGC